MNDAPETIWLTGFYKEEYGGRIGRGTVTDLDHSSSPEYPAYRRDDLPAPDPMDDPRVKALVEAGKRLEAARDAMRRIYAALTTTQAHKLNIQKELDEAWSDFDAALAALEADDG
jgi:hypothetical protein